MPHVQTMQHLCNQTVSTENVFTAGCVELKRLVCLCLLQITGLDMLLDSGCGGYSLQTVSQTDSTK